MAYVARTKVTNSSGVVTSLTPDAPTHASGDLLLVFANINNVIMEE